MPGNRFNDSECDPEGRLWAGTMSDREWNAPKGSLYRLGPDLRFARMRTEVVCSNGTAGARTAARCTTPRASAMPCSPTTSTARWAPSPTAARSSSSIPAAASLPDGLTVDAEGFVWSAHVGKGRIVRYDPTGRAERQVQLPVTRGTSCMFGGDDLRTLFITSARETLTPETLAEGPLAGSLFASEVGVAGRPTNRFAG